MKNKVERSLRVTMYLIGRIGPEWQLDEGLPSSQPDFGVLAINANDVLDSWMTRLHERLACKTALERGGPSGLAR